MRTALGFVRVSSVEQVKHEPGLANQRQRVREYGVMEGLDLAPSSKAPTMNPPNPHNGGFNNANCTRICPRQHR
jgi:hypothetical protein